MTTEAPERVLAEMKSERTARDLMTAVAGELGAIYDAIRDEYRYKVDGSLRRLALRAPEGTTVRTIVYIQEVKESVP